MQPCKSVQTNGTTSLTSPAFLFDLLVEQKLRLNLGDVRIIHQLTIPDCVVNPSLNQH